jgi:hypothetical protein
MNEWVPKHVPRKQSRRAMVAQVADKQGNMAESTIPAVLALYQLC